MESSKSWKLWLLIILIILIVLWLFVGRRSSKKEFIGIKPLLIEEEITPYKKIIVPDISPIAEICETNTIKYVPTQQKERKGKMERSRKSRGEELCCQIMEKIYGVPFVSVRLPCLKNPESGANLEIDCYNEELKIGVEYNGEQHYIYPNTFHRSKEEFISQIRRDQYKIETCDKEGIYLITVPYNVELNKIEEYIRFHLPESVKAREQYY
jgi:hypothetical protein